jgi:hypothetical protein
MNPETEAPDRNPDGTFIKGNPGGPGRPDGSGKAQRWGRLLQEATTQEQFLAVWQEVIDSALEGKEVTCPKCHTVVAHRGDPKAAATFFERLMGKAPQAIEVTGGNGEPLVVKLTWPEKPA